jgi:hypothetical protein
MVNRFLGWTLPDNFNPDGGVAFVKIENPETLHEYRYQPSGTNLLDATQAEAMVRYMLEDLTTPAGGEGDWPDWRHVANEWADMATSGLQWLRNIKDGISTVDDALENMNACLEHCVSVREAAHTSPLGEGLLPPLTNNEELLDRFRHSLRDVPASPAPLGEEVVEALQAMIDLAASESLVTSSYCEVCERHAPKDQHGKITGPVSHDADCPIGKARTILARVEGDLGKEGNGSAGASGSGEEVSPPAAQHSHGGVK